MRARQIQVDCEGGPGAGARRGAGPHHIKLRLQAIAPQIHRAHIRPCRKTIGHDRSAHARHHARKRRIIEAQNGQSVERQVVQKFHETRFQTLEITVVGAQVIIVDIGDDGDQRLQVREARVTFVGLGHQIATRAQTRIGIGAFQAAPDHKGGIRATLREDAGDQTGRRGLAMRAGHCDRIAEAHQLAQHLGALHDRDARGQRRHDFRILRSHGAGDHDHIGAVDVPVRMTDGDPGALLYQTLRGGIGLQVRALHAIAQIDEHLGDATHATATNTDQVDGVDAAHAVGAIQDHAAPPCKLQAGLGQLLRGPRLRQIPRPDGHLQQARTRSVHSFCRVSYSRCGVRSRSATSSAAP